MTDVMNYSHVTDQRVRLPSIKELTNGLQTTTAQPPQPTPPASVPASAAPLPLPQQQQQMVQLPMLATTPSASISSESSTSRNSSISALPLPSQTLPQRSPLMQPMPNSTIPLPPHQPQYITTISPHGIPHDAILVSAPVPPPPPAPSQMHSASPPPPPPQMMGQPQLIVTHYPPQMHHMPLHPHNRLHPFPPHQPQPAPKKKRPRRKANEMVRLYACNYKGCRNSYGTLNHLNAHITFKRHGPKRKPEEFKQIRELYKLQKKLTEKEVAGEEGMKLLKEIEEKQELPVFHQQRGYNGYGRLDHTLKKDELVEKLPEVLGLDADKLKADEQEEGSDQS